MITQLKAILIKIPIVSFVLKNLYACYENNIKILDTTIWTNAHVYRIIKNDYKPEHKVNKIAFIIDSTHNLDHIENILKYLDKDEFDIVPAIYRGQRKDGMSTVMRYAKLHGYNCVSIHEVFSKRIYYKLGIGTHNSTACAAKKQGKTIAGIELLAQKRLKMLFSIGVARNRFIETDNMIFDYIVCISEYQKKEFEKAGVRAKIFASGSPRFERDKEKSGPVDIAMDLKINIDPNKKTILWLPGHNIVSSIPEFLYMVNGLQNDFNIILKPHPLLYNEINNLDNIVYAAIPGIYIINDVNTVKLAPYADFVFCDYGGSVFTAIAEDRNILLFNSDKKKYCEKHFGNDSPEIVIRDRIINFNKEEKERLFSALRDEAIWREQAEIRKQILGEYFTENKTAAQDIANILKQIVNDEI